MSDNYPVIPASDTTPVEVPVVVETTVTKTYDRFWIAGFRCPAPDPNGVVTATAILVKGLKDANGVWELSPREEDRVIVQIPDIFTLAQTDVDVAQGIGAVLSLVVKYATIQGKI